MPQRNAYPSQKRYQAKNPSVSFRLKKEEKEKLDKLADREGMTPGQYVRDFLNGLVEEREKEDEIYAKGYEKGKEDWQILYPCIVCNELLFVEPNGEEHKLIVEFLKNQRWGHLSHEKAK